MASIAAITGQPSIAPDVADGRQREPHPSPDLRRRPAPDHGRDIAIGADGTWRIEGFLLPTSDRKVETVRCADRPGACVLGWQPEDASAFAFVVPLDLSG